MLIGRTPWIIWLFFGALLIFFLLALYARAGENPTHKPRAKWHLVARVVDGDTLVLENKEKVRLIGWC
jgi:endonuclease YncB( thermonuclease family)